MKTAKPRKGGDGVGSDSKAGRSGNEIDDVKVNGGEVEVDEVGKKVKKRLSPKIRLSPKKR